LADTHRGIEPFSKEMGTGSLTKIKRNQPSDVTGRRGDIGVECDPG